MNDVNADDATRPERREGRRYPVTLPVTFDGGQGWTRDVSAFGMFFTTEWPFRVGSRITFKLALDHAEPGQGQEVKCEGVVVRVEPGDRQHGVAVSIDFYDIGQVYNRSDGPAADRPSGG